MFNYLSFSLIIVIFALGFILGFVSGMFIVTAKAEAQTPTVTAPNPQSGIQFIPQRAYVTTLTPDNLPVQLQPIQQGDGTLNSIIPALVASAAAYLAAKTQGDRKVTKVADVTMDNQAEIVKSKQVDKELARVTYKMNEPEAAKITDAPIVKTEALAKDADDFAAKAAKTKLP